MRYGIIGDGRAARHFKHYLERLNLAPVQWSRRIALERRLACGKVVAGCDVIAVLVSDSAIESVIRSELESAEATLVHFSGALATPLAYGAHPLTTFGPDLYEPEYYRRLPFVLSEEGPGFHSLFPDLPNPSFRIREEDRPLYHALAVLAGNFSTVLWKKLFEDFERRLGLPAEAALPYLEKIAANLATSPGGALTGPLARGDESTMRANLNALEGDPYRKVYEAFISILTPEAQEE